MRGSSQAATFWGDDLESHGAVRAVCVPVGTTSEEAFERRLRALRAQARVPLAEIPRSGNLGHHLSKGSGNFWPAAIESLVADAPDPFSNASDYNAARFDFIGSGSVLHPSPFLDLQPHRRVLAIVGICHCPSTPDIVHVFKTMEDRMQKVSVNKAQYTVWRCIAFDISDAQLTALQELSAKSVINLVPILP
eukprot:g2085.t1